jgi:hypothetical protein
MLDQKVFKSGYEVSKVSEIAKAEKNDCFVRAVSNAFEVTYNTAHSFVKTTFNRKDKRGTKGTKATLQLLKDVTLEDENQVGQLSLFPKSTTRKVKYIGSNPKSGGKLYNTDYTHKKVAFTVKTFLNKFSKGTYLVLVHKHALVIKDGILIDNNDMRFNGYRRPVESAFKII